MISRFMLVKLPLFSGRGRGLSQISIAVLATCSFPVLCRVLSAAPEAENGMSRHGEEGLEGRTLFWKACSSFSYEKGYSGRASVCKT